MGTRESTNEYPFGGYQYHPDMVYKDKAPIGISPNKVYYNFINEGYVLIY